MIQNKHLSHENGAIFAYSSWRNYVIAANGTNNFDISMLFALDILIAKFFLGQSRILIVVQMYISNCLIRRNDQIIWFFSEISMDKEETTFTVKDQSGDARLKKDRPVLLISSTSWTGEFCLSKQFLSKGKGVYGSFMIFWSLVFFLVLEDEDFGILLSALDGK